ncbi:unnamed protein product [Leptidea sinapis]|uniref:Uncharacterized protein n=1 Tax=Leptidea sinapis TaxID=189913 RepID=A0A5E4PTA2_9NEOP|nr:unnamed protein product [Leptidea sinapis]
MSYDSLKELKSDFLIAAHSCNQSRLFCGELSHIRHFFYQSLKSFNNRLLCWKVRLYNWWDRFSRKSTY